jgi:prevent-host-death family protein
MKNNSIGAFDAKTHLSELLSKVQRGQSYTITRRGKPVAELRPVEKPAAKKSRADFFGIYKGQIYIAPDFDAPLDDFKEYM